MTHHTQKNIRLPEDDVSIGALTPALYIVATPIGNLRDITLRALDVLRGVDKIACEDTRVSGKLLKAYNISKPSFPYNDHSDERKRTSILDEIENGKSIALISDAGSPLISDPGYKLVRDAIDRGIQITSIPGASAVITAMQLSGLPSDVFSFIGFLPNKQKARHDALNQWKDLKNTLICYETGPRLMASLEDISTIMGDRKICVARELTKMYEEVKTHNVLEMLEYYQSHGQPKGEIVLIIDGAQDDVWDVSKIHDVLSEALKTMKTKQAAAHVAELSGWSKKELYEIALTLSKASKS